MARRPIQISRGSGRWSPKHLATLDSRSQRGRVAETLPVWQEMCEGSDPSRTGVSSILQNSQVCYPMQSYPSKVTRGRCINAYATGCLTHLTSFSNPANQFGRDQQLKAPSQRPERARDANKHGAKHFAVSPDSSRFRPSSHVSSYSSDPIFEMHLVP